MKKTTVMMMVLLLTVISSVAFAGDKAADDGKLGRLFLFQKCDPSLAVIPSTEELPPDEEIADPMYDSNGCPLPGNGPWPIFPGNRRWGQMNYNLLGEEFKFSFQGKRLLPETDYTLIYYPDPWPGEGLMCLGSNTTNADGNVQIHGKLELLTGLPAPYDANFNPVEPSGASGAKIWLVPSADVECQVFQETDGETGEIIDEVSTHMVGWNPSEYLFEGNLIVYQYFPESVDDTFADDTESEDEAEGSSEGSSTFTGNGNGGNNGKSRGQKNNRF